MSDADLKDSPPEAPARSAQQAGNGGYRKGEQTRERILEAALQGFGVNGYEATTTRHIADRAGVNLPALKYYFGGKEGLYLACAQSIVESYRKSLGQVAEPALQGLSQVLTPLEAVAHLKKLFEALAKFLLLSDEAVNRTLFVTREIASPGPAFDILNTELWQPGIELAAALIEKASKGRLDGAQARIRSLMMISSLTGLATGRNVVARTLSQKQATALVIAALEEQIGQISGQIAVR